MRKIFLAFFMIVCQVNAEDQKIYVDAGEIDSSFDTFKIHTGHNMWIETESIHSDLRGMYIYESSIILENNVNSEYTQKWKCPYCHMFWPRGQKCGNPECPSKYHFSLKGA